MKTPNDNAPPPEPARPRSLTGWLWRFALVGAVCGPPTYYFAWGITPDGYLSCDTMAFSPMAGAVIGAACGAVGWVLGKFIRP